MSTILCITVRFIHPFPLFHGRTDGGQPEWPPSPMRAFQALVCAVSSRTRGRPLPDDLRSAIATVEAIRPLIIAPPAKPATAGHRAYVPHNQADLVSAAWNRGNLKADIAQHRIEKDYRPMRIQTTNDQLPAIHYLYSLDQPVAECQRLIDAIRPSVRSITTLGWGIDQVCADATLITELDSLALLAGQHWHAVSQGGRELRVLRRGSFDALALRHEKLLSRLAGGDFTPVPPATALDVVSYRRDHEPSARPHAVFKLLDAGDDTYRHPHTKLVHIAGMVRHLAIETMKRNPPPWKQADPTWLETFVCGHRGDAPEHQQISFVPLPSIGHAHADGMIRNIMLIAPAGCERELEFVAERIDGERLTPEDYRDSGETAAQAPRTAPDSIARFKPPPGKFIKACYLATSSDWHTVTPVILDGHSRKSKGDKLQVVAERTAHLITAALQRAGIETPCKFTWQSIPFLKNCLSAHKYDRDGRHTGYHRPAHLQTMTAVHLSLTFDHPVPGPITLGAGRHCGFGLFSAATENTYAPTPVNHL